MEVSWRPRTCYRRWGGCVANMSSNAVRWLAVTAFLGGCPPFITNQELLDRYDPDGDGVLWPDDCDDSQAELSTPVTWYRDHLDVLGGR